MKPKTLSAGLVLMLCAMGLHGQHTARNTGGDASKEERGPAPSGKLDFQTDLFTGRFSYAVPIQLAPGRHGSEPQLALQYSSAAENGWVGYGWELELGHIQREARDGVPVKWGTLFPLKEYDDAKGFTFSLAGQSSALVFISGTEYRAEIEAGFLKFNHLTSGTNAWLVTDKSGNKYLFGSSADSRMANTKSGWPSNDASGTFRWALRRIETVNGDTTTITYTNIGGLIYPLRLSYNGHTAGLSATHTVDFALETRTDTRFSYLSGYRVATSRRLAGVTNRVSGALVRRYELNYLESPSTKRSLMNEVVVYGTNNTSALPPITFKYSAQQFAFNAAVNWTNLHLPDTSIPWKQPSTTSGGALLADLVDMNGDGLPDRFFGSTAPSPPYTNFLVQRNTGAGFGPSFFWGPINSQGLTDLPAWSVINSGVTRLLDINGDALPDRVMDPKQVYETHGPNDLIYTNFVIEINHGAGFNAATLKWTNVVPSKTGDFDPVPSFLAIENDGLVKMIDMNGDGRPDRLMRKFGNVFPPLFTNFWVQFNTGRGFTSTNAFGPYFSQGQSNNVVWSATDSGYARLLDLNGDNLPDRVMGPFNPVSGGPHQDGQFTNFVVEYNNGHGFEPAVIWGGVDPQYNQPATANCAGTTTIEYCNVIDTPSVALRDINGDGLPDRLMRKFCHPYTNWMVQINTGTSFAPIQNFGPYNSQGQTADLAFTAIDSQDARLMDIDGDGLPDRVMTKYLPAANDNFLVVELSRGPFPDLLTTVSNGIGGSVFVTYKPSTDYDNRESTGNLNSRRLLPFPIYTVASVSVSDGLYPSNTTAYAYEGGMWSSQRREFHGFCCVKVIDPLNTTNVHWFHQAGGRDNSALGEFSDGTNNIGRKGFPFRIETIGSDGNLYKLVLNKVREADLGGGRRFGFIGQTLEIDYPGNLSDYRAIAKEFEYNFTTGNLTNTVEWGRVTSADPESHVFSDSGTDVFYQKTTYATLSNSDIIDKPESVVVYADAAGQTILRETLNTYDGATGNLTRQRLRICEGSYRTNEFGYDTYRNRSSATDAAGITTTLLYDTAHQTFPRQQTVAGSFISTSVHDPCSGALLLSIDPKGLVTSNAYDVFLRITNTWVSKTANGPANTFVAIYDYGLGGMVTNASKNHMRVRKVDGVDLANGHAHWTYYDGLGRPIQARIEAETNGFRVVDSAYTRRGDLRFETLPYLSAGTAYALPLGGKLGTLQLYDAVGRLTNTSPCMQGNYVSGTLNNFTNPADEPGSPIGVVSISYRDGNNPWVMVRTDEEGKARKLFLDAFGRTNQIVEVNGGSSYTTTLGYDRMGSLTNILDHAGNSMEFAYNDLGERIAMADPDMGVWEYRLDVAGRIREQVDAKGQKVRFDYSDPLGRLKTRNVYNSAGAYVHGVTNVYDSSDDGAFTVFSGQLYKVSDAQGSQKHSYDVRDRTLKTARFLTKNGQTYTTTFDHDDADHVRRIVYPNGGPTITNVYDSGGNFLRAQRIDGTNTLVYYNARSFNELGQLAEIDFGNGLRTTNNYFDCLRRLQRIRTYRPGSTNLQDLTYTYDRVSNVKSIGDGVYTGAAAATLNSILYDDLHRVTSLEHPTHGSKTYTYNAIGNVVNNGDAGASGTTYGYGVRMPHAVKAANGKSYAYDANGNMVARAGQKLEYDAENRLDSVSANGSMLASFGYAGDGTRLWKSTATTTQVWVGAIYEEKDGKILFHVFADDKRVCTFDSTTTNVFDYYNGDHLGSTSTLTDRTGNRVQHFEYTAYGREQHKLSSTTFAVSHRYTGKVLDEDVGLYFYEARYYDPELARFTQPDLTIPDLSDPQSYNRYSYTLNNPLKYVDPDGQRAISATQQGFVSRDMQHRLELSRFQRETAQVTVSYATPFQRAAARIVSEQNQLVTFGRVLRQGEAFISARPASAATRQAPLSQNYDASSATGFFSQVGSSGTGNRPFYVTPRGVAISSQTLARQGSSPAAGNFQGLAGSTVGEVIARVPSGWTWAPQRSGAGIVFRDTGGFERIRLHGPSMNAPPNSNSRAGWTLRVMDRTGNYHDNAGRVVPYRANEGHIPLFGNQNVQ